MYFGEPYKIDLEDTVGSLTIYEPTIWDMVKIGEDRFFHSLNVFVTNTTANKLSLWDVGLDWCVMSDFELFSSLIQGIDPDVWRMFFKDCEVSDFHAYNKHIEDKDILVLYNDVAKIEITEMVYFHISQYLRTMFNIFPEEKITRHKDLKETYIMVERSKRDFEQKKKDKNELEEHNQLQSIISACINHPGFKHSLKDLRDVGVAEFYDSVQRLQIYEHSTACLKGLFSGMVDSKKIKPEEYNFMKEITHD